MQTRTTLTNLFLHECGVLTNDRIMPRAQFPAMNTDKSDSSIKVAPKGPGILRIIQPFFSGSKSRALYWIKIDAWRGQCFVHYRVKGRALHRLRMSSTYMFSRFKIFKRWRVPSLQYENDVHDSHERRIFGSVVLFLKLDGNYVSSGRRSTF